MSNMLAETQVNDEAGIWHSGCMRPQRHGQKLLYRFYIFVVFFCFVSTPGTDTNAGGQSRVMPDILRATVRMACQC